MANVQIMRNDSLDDILACISAVVATSISSSSDPAALQSLVEKSTPYEEEDRDMVLGNSDELFKSLGKWMDKLFGKSGSLSDKHVSLGSSICNFVAELAKLESARVPLVDAGFLQFVVDAHKYSRSKPPTTILEKLTIQSLRAMANLCFDNDNHRDMLLDMNGAIKCVTGSLESSSTSVVQTACGALLNISMDNEPLQVQILEANGMSLFLDVIQFAVNEPTRYTNPGLASTSIQALSNLLEIDKGIQDLVAIKGLAVLMKIINAEHTIITNPSVSEEDFIASLNILEPLTTILELVGEKDDVQRLFVSLDLLNILLDFVDHLPKIPLPSPEPLDPEDEPTNEPTYPEIRKRVSRIVTLVTMNDANMYDIPKHPDVVSRFKNWMTLGHGSGTENEEDELRMSGALSLGNLARSDEICSVLLHEHNVGPALRVLLLLETDRIKAGSGISKSAIKVIHAVVGALKNLSLCVDERKFLGELDLIHPVAVLLDMPALKPVHFASVGIIKNLCGSGNDLNAYRVVTGRDLGKEETSISHLKPVDGTSTTTRTPLNKVVNRVWRATSDNMAGIRNEGARVIVNLIRTFHVKKAPQFIKSVVDASGIPLLVQIVTGALLTFTTKPEVDGEGSEDEHHHEGVHQVHFDALPSEGQLFPIVQNEGIIALILLINAYPAAIPMITKYKNSLIPASVSLLSSGLKETGKAAEPLRDAGDLSSKPIYSDEMKVNMCLLMGELVNSDASFRSFAKTALIPIVSMLEQLNPGSTSSRPSSAQQSALPSIKSASRPSSASPTNTSKPAAVSPTRRPVRTAMGPSSVGGGTHSSDLVRVETKSAKNIVPGIGSSINSLRRELEDAGKGEGVEEGLRLGDAAKRLLAVLQKSS